jgi:hypothetical protein
LRYFGTKLYQFPSLNILKIQFKDELWYQTLPCKTSQKNSLLQQEFESSCYGSFASDSQGNCVIYLCLTMQNRIEDFDLDNLKFAQD